MKKFVAIATAGCMFMAAAPAMAAPVSPAFQPATASTPTIGLRSRMIKRAATTAPRDANKFLSNMSDQDKTIVGSSALLAIILGIIAATSGSS